MNPFDVSRKRKLWSAVFWLFLGIIFCMLADNSLVVFVIFFVGYVAGMSGEKYQSARAICDAVKKQQLKIVIDKMPTQQNSYFSEN